MNTALQAKSMYLNLFYILQISFLYVTGALYNFALLALFHSILFCKFKGMLQENRNVALCCPLP